MTHITGHPYGVSPSAFIHFTLLSQMQFQLPQNLQQALIDYDPNLKKLAQQDKANKTAKKNTNSLGVFDLKIPHDVISPSALEAVMKNINTKPAAERGFYRSDDSPSLYRRLAIQNISGIWYAVWTPPEGADYLYGYAFAFNANESTYKKLEGYLRTYADEYEPNTKCGRKLFYVHSHCVTAQDICDNKHSCRSQFIHTPYLTYRDNNIHHKERIRTIKHDIMGVFAEKNLQWDDENAWYSKIVAMSQTPFEFTLKHQGFETQYRDHVIQTLGEEHYNSLTKVDVDSLLFSIKEEHKYSNESSQIHCILDKPFMRKWLFEVADHINTNLYSSKRMRHNFVPLERLKRFVWAFSFLEKVWPNSPIDFYQNNKELLYSLERSFIRSTYLRHDLKKSAEWLRNNMSIKTFISLLSKEYDFHYERAKRSSGLRSYYHCRATDHFEFSPDSIQDAMRMTQDILDAGKELDPPKRWRDWHDHVMSIHWKLKHPCISLPQDLFPEPVKQDGYCFFQPINTHQLAEWGRAVRNCVGNSNYSDAIKKKQYFIVLAMQDNKPMFTVQLKVRNGVMLVDQIVGIANSSLSTEEREAYTKTFASALQKRSEQLS